VVVNVLDLFSGIGGFSLGLERAGMRTVAFCEIEPYCRAVLKKHWPDVPCYEDVRTLTKQRLDADGVSVELIAGGFPCQDISLAGKGAGIADGTRSGLWAEIARLSGELRPRYVVVENVAALLGRGLERVLGDLAAVGFDAEWHCIPASALGAPHRRDRFWLVAYPASARAAERSEHPGRVGADFRDCPSGDASDPDIKGLEKWQGQDASRAGAIFRPVIERNEWWAAEPDVGRVAHGVPSRVDRLSALGNAVVPQIPEIIGRAIMQAEGLA
jgi:DNA (cytosine-5)-methyltransferase 1